jgi:hypothetical protein
MCNHQKGSEANDKSQQIDVGEKGTVANFFADIITAKCSKQIIFEHGWLLLGGS